MKRFFPRSWTRRWSAWSRGQPPWVGLLLFSGLWIQGATTTVGSALFIGCSYPTCFDGVLPFDGQTGVDPGTVIVFQSLYELNGDIPSLRAAITLERLDGESDSTGDPVPFNLEVDLESGTVEVRPVEPLAENTWYRATGLDRRALEGTHYRDVHRRVTNTSTFYTGSEPRLLAIVGIEDDDDADEGTASTETVVLAFSEAMDVESVSAAVQFMELETEEVLEPTLLGNWEGLTTLVAFSVPGDVVVVSLAEGAESSHGVVFEGLEAEVAKERYANQRSEYWMDPWLGNSTCEDW